MGYDVAFDSGQMVINGGTLSFSADSPVTVSAFTLGSYKNAINGLGDALVADGDLEKVEDGNYMVIGDGKGILAAVRTLIEFCEDLGLYMSVTEDCKDDDGGLPVAKDDDVFHIFLPSSLKDQVEEVLAAHGAVSVDPLVPESWLGEKDPVEVVATISSMYNGTDPQTELDLMDLKLQTDILLVDIVKLLGGLLGPDEEVPEGRYQA